MRNYSAFRAQREKKWVSFYAQWIADSAINKPEKSGSFTPVLWKSFEKKMDGCFIQNDAKLYSAAVLRVQTEGNYLYGSSREGIQGKFPKIIARDDLHFYIRGY